MNTNPRQPTHYFHQQFPCPGRTRVAIGLWTAVHHIVQRGQIVLVEFLLPVVFPTVHQASNAMLIEARDNTIYPGDTAADSICYHRPHPALGH
jgi:hypothetical protein